MEHYDLARAGVGAHADLRIELRAVAVGVGVHHDDAHRMLARGLVRRLNRIFVDVRGGDDDEREHATEGDRAALFAHADEFASDRRRIRVVERDNHGRLQVRLSRASSSAADAGPHEPGA